MAIIVDIPDLGGTGTDGGETFVDLQDMVLGNTFSSSYRDWAKKLLNDAVTEACKRLGWHRATAVCAYSSAGVVTQPTTPFFRVDEVWLADASATGTGEQVMANHAVTKLEPLPWATAADAGYGEAFYTARRKVNPDTSYPQLEITVVNPQASGLVVISGLQRPAYMVDDASTSGVGADMDYALIAYARSKLFMLEDDPEMSRVWLGEFQEALVSASAPAHKDGPDITPGTWDDGSFPQRGI